LETLTGVQEGLDGWVVFGGPKAFLSFFVEIHTGVPVSDDPITHPQGTEATWIGEALASAGWTGANAYQACFAYNNALRDAFETNWCYSYFIVDSDPAVNQGLFSTGGYAWAYFGGPWVYMSRYSTWAYNWQDYHKAVIMHELGHIYYATDEYDGGAQTASGYLGLVDSGNPGVACIMNQNWTGGYCNGTKRQIAWRDLDLNDIIEPLDVAPLAAVDERTPDPTSDTEITWTGTATVTTIPNQNPNAPYFPPHDITVSTITAVECRVDGGPWSAATATDGTFDAYVEDFTWLSGTLAPGFHTVEARARNSQGIWSDVFGADTLEIVTPTEVRPVAADVAGLRLDPARPNPARGSTELRFSLPRAGHARVAIYSVDGARVRLLLDGERKAGPHVVAWNGRGETGEPVPAGVYLARLETADGERTVKLVRRR
ncbi:MAG TPA: FlgD immunoglobulin-like domain containing protein, partial [bacterium]|nr:FlgD immunoglobulin-like domain containing protein [bacterium]